MNSLAKSVCMQATPVRKATIKDRLFTASYLTIIAVAMLGWLTAFGWIAVAIVKSLSG